MLQLKNIVKTYVTGETKHDALKGINITFRENEFVSILGQSGSGKTTLLNIIGGLDRYTSGDLLIKGISTKKYYDEQWDAYRNQSIGFVFQSYNLIPHQSVLSNVELSLTLAGVSKKERRKRAEEVLKKVGLEEHMHKKPNQMSGGQMQRVAIARALINNPEILLADEPTGALDSETSIQIMELLKEIAKDKLVIMVTHNPELAEKYSTRIINIHDGKITSDTNPYEADNTPPDEKKKIKLKLPMPFKTALSLSFNNLRTKKGRTILTAFAGSIGIIGIALVLSLSSGMQDYISDTQQNMLSSYPITIQSQSVDVMSNRQEVIDEKFKEKEEHTLDKIYQGGYASDELKSQSIQTQKNDLKQFREYIESNNGAKIRNNTSTIQYGYDIDLQIYKADTDNGIVQISPKSVSDNESENSLSALSSLKDSVGLTDTSVFSEMIGDEELLSSQYEVLAGKWPSNYDELVLVVNSNNELDDLTLYSLGLKDKNEIEEIKELVNENKSVDNSKYDKKEYSYDELLNLTFKLVNASDYYEKSNGSWVDKSTDKEYLKSLINNATDLKISGIVRAKEDAQAGLITGSIGYTSALTEFVSEKAADSEIVKEQLADQSTNILTGIKFVEIDKNTDKSDLMNSLSAKQKTQLLTMSEEERMSFMASYLQNLSVSYDDIMKGFGYADINNPSSISLYLQDFNSRDKIISEIDKYNETQNENNQKDKKITYTDMIGMMTSSINKIIDMVTYLLIGFVSISLIVSSIMIGIITYISVLERTKEIGILRSIGASKSDISRVFNAETIIIGLTSGLIGIGVTLLLIIPANLIIEHLTGVANLAALPVLGAVILIIISVALTMIAGLIPSKIAAKKDPVTALRSE